MTKQELFCAIGDVREEWINDADAVSIRRATRARRAGRLARRVGAVAACLVLLLTAGYRFACWYFPLGAYEQVMRITPVVFNNRLMMYAFERLGDGQEMMLRHQRGEYLGHNGAYDVWQLKGRDDYAELIFSDGENWELGRFNQYSALAQGWTYDEEADADWWYASLMTPEEWRKIDTSAYTLVDVLQQIYGVDSADDIVSVRFEKSGIDNTQIGRSVKVETVTLRDADEIAQVWNILISLTPTDHYADRPTPTVAKPDNVRSVQVVRDVTISFKNGTVLEFEYNPSGGEDCALFYRIEGYNYYYLTVEQNHTLIDLAGISFAPTPIPETKPPRGVDETATVRPPETAVAPTAPETIPE